MDKYIELLERTLEVQSKSGNEKRMKKFVRSYLKELGLEPLHDNKGNIYCHKGDKRKNRPFVVAHLDTVHNINGNVKLFRNEQFFYAFDMKEMSQYGVGGDDKVGVWAALAALTEFDDISAAFFVQEEHGCLGSGEADMKQFKNANWLAQLDRRENEDFIIYQMVSKEFEDDMTPLAEAYGMKVTKQSTITDVAAIYRKNVNVSCVNIASGYYYPHSNKEVVHIGDAKCSLALLFAMVLEYGDKKYVHKYVPYVPAKTTVKGFGKRGHGRGRMIYDGKNVEFINGKFKIWNDMMGMFEWRDVSGTLLYYESDGSHPGSGSNSTALPSPQKEIEFDSPLNNVDDIEDQSGSIEEYMKWRDKMDEEKMYQEANKPVPAAGGEDEKPIRTYHNFEVEYGGYSEKTVARRQLEGFLHLYGYTFKEFFFGDIPDDMIKNISASTYHDTGHTVAYYERVFDMVGTYQSADHTDGYTSFDRAEEIGDPIDNPAPF
jgi:hypothetical protein